ncbi:alpha/beta fold hydrolase [Actinokineospora pegani]|uniref:alpha/beta fold hydrolase n=1 Tax=Actinokineospora pegani TaxID=2654637 RepID=UPI0018D37557|nr:alpha/beta hydrolase [Actinokineospora pegani]
MNTLVSETPLSENHDAATRDDREFARHFEHRFTTVDGVQMHYVVGGDGPQPIVLLHGFGETWFGWRGILEDLLPGHTVIAIDLPGLGDSTGELPSHDKVTLAGYIHRLLDELGHTEGVRLVSHDAGGGIAFALVTRWRQQFSGLLMLDFPVTGGSLTYEQLRALSYHFSFHEQEPLFEQLVAGRERLYLEYFYRAMSPGVDEPMPPHVVEEYVRVYSRPGAFHNGSRYYQAWPQDELDNRAAMADPITMPVHFLGQAPLFEAFLTAIRGAAPQATGAPLETGHWMLHEAPERVLREIKSFFGYDG